MLKSLKIIKSTLHLNAKGAPLVEYVVLMAFIGVLLITFVLNFGQQVRDTFSVPTNVLSDNLITVVNPNGNPAGGPGSSGSATPDWIDPVTGCVRRLDAADGTSEQAAYFSTSGNQINFSVSSIVGCWNGRLTDGTLPPTHRLYASGTLQDSGSMPAGSGDPGLLQVTPRALFYVSTTTSGGFFLTDTDSAGPGDTVFAQDSVAAWVVPSTLERFMAEPQRYCIGPYICNFSGFNFGVEFYTAP